MAEAQEATERYLELVRGLGNNPAAEAMAHGRLAKIKEAQGDLEDAKESYTLQFELAQTVGKEDIQKAALEGISRVAFNQDDHEGYIEYSTILVQALPDAQAQKKAQLYTNIGSIYLSMQNFDEAEANLRSALNLYNELESRESVYKALKTLASVYQAKGSRTEQAAVLQERAALAEELGLLEEKCELDLEAGMIYLKQGFSDTALPLLEAACHLAITEGFGSLVARVFPAAQQALHDLGYYPELADNIQAQLELDAGMGAEKKVKLQSNLGYALRKQEKWGEAARVEEDAAATAMGAGNVEEAAKLAGSAAALFDRAGESAEHERLMKKRVEYLKQNQEQDQFSSLYDYAYTLTKQKKLKPAVEEWEKCFLIAEDDGQVDRMLEVASILVSINSELEDQYELLSWQRQRIRLLKDKGDREELAKSLLGTGATLCSDADMASQNEGIGLLDEAKELFKALEDAMNALVALGILVEAYQRQNRHEEVRELLKEQLQIKRSLSESIDAEAINKVADSYLKQKQYKEARAAFTEARQVALNAQDVMQELIAVSNLTTIALSMSQIMQANDLSKKGLELAHRTLKAATTEAEKAEAHKYLGSVYCQLGSVNQLKGEMMDAIKFFQEGRNHSLEVGDEDGDAAAVAALGTLYLQLNEVEMATDYLRKVLEYADKSADKKKQCSANLDLGNAMLKSNMLPEARTHLETSLALAEELDDVAQLTGVSGALSNLYFLLQEYDQALELNKKALKLAEETGNMISMSRIMGNIGTLYHKTGEPDKGLEYHVRHMKWAEHVGDKSGYGVACNRIGAILNEKIDAQFKNEAAGNAMVSVGQVEEALRYHEHYLRISRDMQDKEGEGAALKAIAYTKIQKSKVKGSFGDAEDLAKLKKKKKKKNPLASSDKHIIAMKQAETASHERLRWVAVHGTIKEMKFLVEQQRLDPDAHDEQQRTSLHLAAAAGRLDMVKYLCEEAMANVNCETVNYDSPYALALGSGKQDVANYLKNVIGVIPFIKAKVIKELDRRRMAGPEGADFRTFSDYHKLAWDGKVSQDMADHQELDPYGRTTLMMAAHRGQLDWVRTRLERDPGGMTAVDVEGWTPLHWCCAGKGAGGREGDAAGLQGSLIAIADLILKYEPAVINKMEVKGLTPYSLALQAGHRGLAAHLRKYKARNVTSLTLLVRYVLFFGAMLLYGLMFPVFVFSGYIRRRRIARILGKIPQSFSLVFRGDLGSKNIDMAESRRATTVVKKKKKGSRRGSVSVDVADQGHVRLERSLFTSSALVVGSLWAFPFILVIIIMPLVKDQGRRGVEAMRLWGLFGVGGYYLLIGLFLIWSVAKSLGEKELKKVRHPQAALRFGITVNRGSTKFAESTSRSFANIFRIIFLFYDFFAFIQLGIPEELTFVTDEDSLEYNSLTEWNMFGKRFLLEFKQRAFFYSFWCASALMGIWYVLSTYMGTSMVVLQIPAVRRFFPFVRPDFFAKIPGLSFIVPLLAVAAFLPVSTVYFKGLDCTYMREGATPFEGLRGVDSGLLFFEQRGANFEALQVPAAPPDGFNVVEHARALGVDPMQALPENWHHCPPDSPFKRCENAYPAAKKGSDAMNVVGCCVATACPNNQLSCLEVQRDQECWTGMHNIYAIVGLSHLLYFIPSCVVVGIYFLEPDDDTCDIRFIGVYMMLESALKWVLALLHTFVSHIPMVSQAACVLITGVLCGANLFWKPCQHIWFINHYRVIAYLLNFWIAVSALFGALSKMMKQDNAIKVAGKDVASWTMTLAVGIGLILLGAFLVHLRHSWRQIKRAVHEYRHRPKPSDQNGHHGRASAVQNPLNGPGVEMAVVKNDEGFDFLDFLGGEDDEGDIDFNSLMMGEGNGRQTVVFMNPLTRQGRASTVSMNPLAEV